MRTPATELELLTTADAARLLDVTPGTLEVWRTTKRYALPYVRVGRNIRYRRSDLVAFVESRLVAA
jgi:excisionase family DNA binding protein